MKASIPLLIALGIASQPVLAQVQTMPEPTPPSGIDVQRDPGTSQPSATDMRQPGNEPSSGGTMAPSSGSGASDTPAESQAGTRPDPTSSGNAGAMQSEAGTELRAAAPPVAELKPVVQGDVTYLCGGIGEQEIAFMKREAKDYDLMLTFAARNGAYLADVDVNIADTKGNSVLQANCDAPIMLVDLPRSGNYRVQAEAEGYTRNRVVRVTNAKKGGPGVTVASMVWPRQVLDAAPTATGGSETGEGAAGATSGSSGAERDSSVEGGAR